jgi:large-conductance mechanosensitive channel
MLKLYQAIGAVLGGTLAGGAAGGVVGAAIGKLAPSFVRWVHTPLIGHTPPNFNATEFGLGLGSVSGLMLGAASSLLLVFAVVIRDAIVAGRGAGKPSAVEAEWS